MRIKTARLAAVALALPLCLPISPAHAAADVVSCNGNDSKPTANGFTSFTTFCGAVAGSNTNAGWYTFQFSWAASPCSLASTSGLIVGDLTGMTPEGAIVEGTALAVINPSGLHDLSLGFTTANGGPQMHSGFFQFDCPPRDQGNVHEHGQIAQLDAFGTPGTAHSADCPYSGFRATSRASYFPAVGSTGSMTATLQLDMNCTGAPGSSSAGSYSITSTGIESGACDKANGSGTLSGTGPGGVSVSGAWAYDRIFAHYYGFPPRGTGYIRMNNRVYQAAFWLDIVPPTTCQYTAATLTGHAAFIG